MIKVTSSGNNTLNENVMSHLSPITYSGQKQLGEPFTKGYSFLLFSYIPKEIATITGHSYSSVDGKENLTETVKGNQTYFFDLLERSFKTINVAQDIELGTTDLTMGFANNPHQMPTEIGKNINQVSITVYEQMNSLFKRPLAQWVSAIRDPETGLYGLENFGSMKYWTVEALYINGTPALGSPYADARAGAVDYALYMTNMFPKKIPYEHHNYESGSHDAVELTIDFSCVGHIGATVEEMARKIVKTDNFFNQFIQTPGKYINDSFLAETKSGGIATNKLSALLGENNTGYTGEAAGTTRIVGIPIKDGTIQNIPSKKS